MIRLSSRKKGKVKIKTPFGYPSAPIEIGDFLGQKIAFLARHGKQHQFPPHMVPQRANIWALNKLGVQNVIGVCTVGSLKEGFKPGEIVISDQFIDFTKKRDYTFFDKTAVHVSMADPFCPELRKLFFKEAGKINIPVHESGTYICIEGPRFSTRAESKFFRNYADIIGMTLVPEVILAKEMAMCYVSLAMITDYDVWQTKPVNAEEVVRTMKENLEKIKKLFSAALPKIGEQCNCSCQKSLEGARL
jgi:5'-methylthioadenosine phosphorylase